MEKQKELHKAKTETEWQNMILVDIRSGQKEQREVLRHSKEFDGDVNKGLIVFLKSADIRGTSLLVWQNKDREDDQWLHLPALKKMQRIARSSRRQYFMGTDFSYVDMQVEELREYEYKCKKEIRCKEGKSCFVVISYPKNKKIKRETGYSKRIFFVEKERFITHQVDFYGLNKKQFKKLINEDFEKISNTMWRAKTTTMERKGKHRTVITTKQRQLNRKIPNHIFTDRFILSGRHTRQTSF